jgi:hypothetical protein
MREAPGVGAPTLRHRGSDKPGHDNCKSRPRGRIEKAAYHGVQALTRDVRRSTVAVLAVAGGTATILGLYYFAIAGFGATAWRTAKQKP